MRKRLILLYLLGNAISVLAQNTGDWIHYGEKTFGKVSFDLYAKRGSWGMGQQFYAANFYNGTSYKIRVEGELYAQLICDNEVVSGLSFTVEPYGEMRKVNPASLDNGSLSDNTGLISSADDNVCKGNEITVRSDDGQRTFKTRTRIHALGVRKLKLTAIQSDGSEVPITTNGELIVTEEEKDREQELVNQQKKEQELKRQQAEQSKQEEQNRIIEKNKQAEQDRQRTLESQQREERQGKDREAENLRQRIAAGNEMQNKADKAQNEMANNLTQIISSEGGTEIFDKLGFGMNLGFGFAALGIPTMQNAVSSQNSIKPYSSTVLPFNVGIYGKPELWLVRNKYFGLGGEGNFAYAYGVFGGGGVNSSATCYGYNIRAQAGLSHFKLIFQMGTDYRSGSYSDDLDVATASTAYATSSGIVLTGSYDYAVSHTGFGAMYEFGDADSGESFLRYTLKLDRPDFLPLNHSSILVHELVFRSVIDIIAVFSNNYPIAGAPLYKFDSDGRNKIYFFFGIGKTFKIFKANY